MTRREGLRPSTKAGNAIEARSDFADRGGTFMMSRLILPASTCASL